MNQVIAKIELHKNKQLQIVQGDLTQETVDAIVNAANTQLQHGGGVAEAITFTTLSSISFCDSGVGAGKKIL